jgi:chloramphenicol 3-O phosphotransferase
MPDRDDHGGPEPVRRWQAAVHMPGIYDLEVDTSAMSAEQCADAIREALANPKSPAAFEHLIGA